jgi:hypothetical protein
LVGVIATYNMVSRFVVVLDADPEAKVSCMDTPETPKL